MLALKRELMFAVSIGYSGRQIRGCVRHLSATQWRLGSVLECFRKYPECFGKFQFRGASCSSAVRGFGIFQNVSIGHPAAPSNGSENPVVEHKEIVRHEAPVSRVTTVQ